jgi:tetratricopeptide (TPR) repeat protein
MARDRAADSARLKAALAASPEDRVSWHNLAAAEGDLGHPEEAEAAARRAIALGVTAPETRLVLARALQSLRRFEAAEAAFREAIAARPAYADAHRDLAQLIWMRTGDRAAALRALDVAMAASDAPPELFVVRSIVLEVTGDPEAALASAEQGLAKAPDDPVLLRRAANLRVATGNPDGALALMRHAARVAPTDPATAFSLCEALLATGNLSEADGLAGLLVRDLPGNQYALALQNTAWRLRHDPRYAALHDYGRLVQARKISTPPGWASLDAFLAALATDLEELHSFRSHPLEQSVRGGSHLQLDRAELERPLVNALFRAIGVEIGRYLEAIGRGPDPLRSRNNGTFTYSGAWSVRLSSGGFHTDHIHPEGWISSACYISLPRSLAAGGATDRAGWLRLGKPNVATRPPLAADCYVKPEAGSLALFPAYVWHGTEPFVSEEPRLTVAFDVVPG